MTSFETFDWNSDAKWKTYLDNLYIPDGPDYERLLNIRKQRWFKTNIDPQYNIHDIQSKQQSAQPSSSTQPSSTSTPPPAAAASSSTSSTSTNSFASKWNVAKITSYTQLVLHSMTLILSIFLVLPLVSDTITSIAFPGILILNMIAISMSLFRSHGRPQINQQYAIKLARDDNSHYLFYALILFAASHSIIYVLPFVMRSTLFVCSALARILPQYNASLYNRIEAPLVALTSQITIMQRSNAMYEILALGYSLLKLVTADRSFVLVLLQLQYLRIRAMLSLDSQMAWQQVAVIFDRLFNQAWMPAQIRTLYFKARDYISRSANPGAQAQ